MLSIPPGSSFLSWTLGGVHGYWTGFAYGPCPLQVFQRSYLRPKLLMVVLAFSSGGYMWRETWPSPPQLSCSAAEHLICGAWQPQVGDLELRQ